MATLAAIYHSRNIANLRKNPAGSCSRTSLGKSSTYQERKSRPTSTRNNYSEKTRDIADKQIQACADSFVCVSRRLRIAEIPRPHRTRSRRTNHGRRSWLRHVQPVLRYQWNRELRSDYATRPRACRRRKLHATAGFFYLERMRITALIETSNIAWAGTSGNGFGGSCKSARFSGEFSREHLYICITCVENEDRNVL